MKQQSHNIQDIVEQHTCLGCGTCINICPNHCISIINNGKTYLAKVNKANCERCGVCIQVCPAFKLDFNSLSLAAFGKPSSHILSGSILNWYMGYSTDRTVRFNASSGGLVTQLLIFALEHNFIDGAIITKSYAEDPLHPLPVIAKTEAEIVSAMGSKYCPVSLNTILTDVLVTDGRYALVGLPCHINGLRLLEEKMPKLKSRIIMRIGLFCGHTQTFEGTAFFLSQLGFKADDVTTLNYRGAGWPGWLIASSGSRVRCLSYRVYSKFYQLFFFTSIGCILCSDPLSQLADISFGDAWLKNNVENDNIGSSVCIVRSDLGKQLVNDCLKEGKIFIQPLSEAEIQTLTPSVSRLRRMSAASLLLKKHAPTHSELRPKFQDYLTVAFYLFNRCLSDCRKLWVLIPIVTRLECRLLERTQKRSIIA